MRTWSEVLSDNDASLVAMTMLVTGQANTARPGAAEQALERAGLTLPAPHPVVANYVMTVRSGSLLFVSGHGPFVDGKPAHIGKIGAGMTVASGQKAAEITTLNLLATLKAELTDLSRVRRFLKLLVFVNSTADFTEHHLVANGATDLLGEVFGKIGRPARSAIGVASLPLGFSVEIEAVVEISDHPDRA